MNSIDTEKIKHIADNKKNRADKRKNRGPIWYLITAILIGSSLMANSVNAGEVPSVAPPTNVKCSLSGTALTVNWDKSISPIPITSYRVHVYRNSLLSIEKFVKEPLHTITFTRQSTTAKYEVHVRSIGANTASSSIIAACKTPAPAAHTLTKPIKIKWSGHTWNVRYTYGYPGPSTFSDSSNNVWVDSQDKLHLKMTKVGGVWRSADVYTNFPVGRGTFTTVVSSNPARLATNVVGGLFYYLDNQNELDIEFSRWGELDQPYNTFYTVRTSTGQVNSPGYLVNSWNTKYILTWDSNNRISFNSKDSSNNIIGSWKYPGTYIPKTGGAFHINLWAIDGDSPADGKEQELILSSFSIK